MELTQWIGVAVIAISSFMLGYIYGQIRPWDK